MTRNRTTGDAISAVGSELRVLLLLALGLGLAVARYFTKARVRLWRVETKLRRRSARRFGA